MLITGGMPTLDVEPYRGTPSVEMYRSPAGARTPRSAARRLAPAGFALRAGVLTNPNKLTAGFGYAIAGFGFDYGFSTGGGTLDSTHQFGLNYAWGGEAQ